MTALDFGARAMAAQVRVTERRLATLDALAHSIAENLPKGLPGLIGAPLVENRSATTQISGGMTYGFSSGDPASHFAHHYALHGGEWEFYSPTLLSATSCHLGNGNDPSANAASLGGPIVRFATWAPRFEILVQNYLGFRIKVNGKYLQDGLYGVAALNGDANGFNRYFLFDFAGTEFAGVGLKQVELSSSITRFGGARVPAEHTVEPWPQAFPLKAALHGDSMPSTFSDNADNRIARHGNMVENLKYLTGISDLWSIGVPGGGFVADNAGTRSDFLEQAAHDIPGTKFDLAWELGGRNDTPFYGSIAAYRAKVEQWIDIMLSDNPDMIIFLTGHLTMTGSEAYQSSATHAAVQDAKKQAAARYPRNCAFIETCGNATTNSPWVSGSGRVGAVAGDGNADLVRGLDGTHPSVFGHQYFAHRLATQTARVIPLLADRVRRGVMAGVNDSDLT